MGLNDLNVQEFRGIKEQLQKMVCTAHRDQEKTLCVHNDTRDAFWSEVVIQCYESELKKVAANQKQDPLDFLSGAFSEA